MSVRDTQKQPLHRARWRSWWGVYLVGLLGVFSSAWVAGATRACVPEWPAWQQFQQQHLAPEGRIIDDSDPRLITTSEGQSYALFFALVDNNPSLFQQLLYWTEQHLARGSLEQHLPAWLWGQQPEGEWGVLDSNPAADADLWIAYSLLEAGRLWQQRHYTVLGHALLQRVAESELVELPQWGWALLPAPQGFVDAQGWRLNPSYLPPQLSLRFAQSLPNTSWAELQKKTTQWLIEVAPLGVAPDWVYWDGVSWQYPSLAEQWASYNAIRVYLWLGMMPVEMLGAKQLQAHFQQAGRYFSTTSGLAESVHVQTGQAKGSAPIGFAQALLPLFAGQPLGELLAQKVAAAEEFTSGYYNQMLSLFAQGWREGRYAFDAKGYLLPQWEGCQ